VLFPPDAVRACLQRVVASEGLRRSQRLVRFLHFVVGALLDGREDEVKERTLAVEVYGRALDYDSSCDPIVRSEAHRLRGKLEAYYAEEGSADPIVIRLPRGSYVPELVAGDTAPHTCGSAPRVFVGFEARNPEDENGALARAMGDAVRNHLATRAGLRVVNRASRLRDGIRAGGVPTQAEFVVDGAVERRGERYRVMARLVRRADGEEIWGGSHSVSASRAAEAQPELAARIADSVASFLQRTGRPQLPARAQAYELFVKGRHAALLYANTYDRRHLEPARQRLAAAVELEPDFVDALAELANVELLQLYPPQDDVGRLVGRARDLLERALAVQPRHARSLYLRGHALGAEGRRREALSLTESALAIDPSDPEARLHMAVRLMSFGFWESARVACEWAFRLDPVWEATRTAHVALLLHLGRPEEARRSLDAIADSTPLPVEHGIGTALFEIAMGRPREAAERLAPLDARDPGHLHVRATLGLALALAGERKEPCRILEALGDAPPFFRDVRIRLALALGEDERALSYLTASPFHRHYRWLATEPLARPVLGRSRWHALLEELHGEWRRDLAEIGPRLAVPPPELPSPRDLLAPEAMRPRRAARKTARPARGTRQRRRGGEAGPSP
jgi:serine/threonine-protein kinase